MKLFKFLSEKKLYSFLFSRIHSVNSFKIYVENKLTEQRTAVKLGKWKFYHKFDYFYSVLVRYSYSYLFSFMNRLCFLLQNLNKIKKKD